MSTKEKKYYGSCYVGVVGGEAENGPCRDTIEAIITRKSDIGPLFIRATKGYEARQMHLNNWYDGTKKAFMLLLDHDMKFPAFTLEQLRSHRLPFVSGLYMRRRIAPIAPVWYDDGQPGVMPLSPLTAIVEANTLYRIGASGWGCMLIHRDVITATKKILKGEDEIIEDDMDLWPYNLTKVMKAINTLKYPTPKITEKMVAHAINTLAEEIRPLRGVKDTVGSDLRYPFYAKAAGFQLWGDSGVSCGHDMNYAVTGHDYESQPGASIRDLSIAVHNGSVAEVARLKKVVGPMLPKKVKKKKVAKAEATPVKEAKATKPVAAKKPAVKKPSAKKAPAKKKAAPKTKKVVKK